MAPNLVEVVKKAERKLTFIPVLFILLRMWGTLQFVFSIVVKESRLVDPTGCISTATYYVYLIITCAQVSCYHFLLHTKFNLNSSNLSSI